ncbi:MAG: hypothetical protein FWD17_05400 [Polyangiaceae bacterium]|nr:hypothetical protein [Polyangiaceae bacterium]
MGFANLRWIGATLLVLGAAGTALAQSASSPAAPPPQVGFERKVQLTPQEQLAEADAILSHMEGAAATIRRLLDNARQARDVVKSLCLSDKLSQVDVAQRSAKDRSVALQSAAQRGDAELANHEFTILAVLRQRVEQLSAEANQCIGEEVAFVGQTQVTTIVDPNLPGTGEENTDFPPVIIAPPLALQPPVAMSPVR